MAFASERSRERTAPPAAVAASDAAAGAVSVTELRRSRRGHAPCVLPLLARREALQQDGDVALRHTLELQAHAVPPIELLQPNALPSSSSFVSSVTAAPTRRTLSSSGTSTTTVSMSWLAATKVPMWFTGPLDGSCISAAFAQPRPMTSADTNTIPPTPVHADIRSLLMAPLPTPGASKTSGRAKGDRTPIRDSP